MGFVLPTKALEDLFRQICMNKNQIMKTYKRKKVLEVIDVVLVVNLQVVEEVKGDQQRPDISPSDITEWYLLGVFILPAAVHVSLAGSYLRISSRLSPLYPPFNNRFSLRGKCTNLTKHKH